jgi:acyl-CoA thioesterase
MTQTTLAALRKRFEGEPFAKAVGIKLLTVAEGYALVEMTCTREMENIFSMVHGGAIFTLLDEAFQFACNSHGTVAVALNVNVTYHRAPEPESTLQAEAKETHRSRRTASYQILVRDERGRLIASCQALAYRREDRLPFLNE